MDTTQRGGGLIAALATPYGRSALAVVRTSGPGCLDALASCFSRPAALTTAGGHRLVYGSLSDPRTGDLVDEVLVGVYRAPKSYTGEDMAEIFCHGSPPGIERLFDLLFAQGFRQAGPGEFTLRAFLNGKLDLTRAEAVQEVVASQSRTAQALALHRLGGAVSARIDRSKQALVQAMAGLSLQIDYPDDEVEEIPFPRDAVAAARADLAALAGTYESGRRYQEGARIVLAGRTNAGKSSLFNALVREERAIVSEVHGTTRDWLEAPFAVEGVPVRLFDTAGLREAGELVEAEGIRRSGEVIGSANLVLYVVDATAQASGLSDEDRGYLAGIAESGTPVVVVWNKTDDPAAVPAPEGFGPSVAVVSLSARTGAGIERLLSAVSERVRPAQSAEDAGLLIDSARQKRLLNRAVEALDRLLAAEEAGMSADLLALDLQDALGALGEITGEVTSEDILDAMFSNFCVGK